MDIRYSASPNDVKRYTTEELRNEFLITDLYVPDTVKATYSHVDRVVILGIMPVSEEVSIDKGIDIWHNFGTEYFLERREAGVFNIGGKGYIVADGVRYDMGYEDCLYITKGVKEVYFGSIDGADPARFYLASYPAHKACKTTFLSCWRHASFPWALPSWLPAVSGIQCPATRTREEWKFIHILRFPRTKR